MATLAVLFGLISTFTWGVGDYVGARAAKRFGGLATGVMITIIAALVFDAIYLLFFRSHTTLNAVGLGYAAASGLAFTVANLTFYKGLEHGPVSVVSPIGSMYPVVTTLLLVALFGSRLGLRQGIGIGIVMLGIAAASGLFNKVQRGQRLSRGPILALCAALSWGLAWVCIAQAITHIGWQLTAAVELTCSSVLFLPVLPLLSRSESGLIKQLLPSFKSPLIWVTGVLLMAGFISLSMGVDRVGDLATTAVAISACYPVITVFLALKKLKEDFRLIPIAGAFTGIAGIVLLSLG